MNRQHPSVDELTDAAEGLLDPEGAAFAESHIAGCPDCQAQSEACARSRHRCVQSLRRPCRRRSPIG
jgi:anti-sigma factor RsiW